MLDRMQTVAGAEAKRASAFGNWAGASADGLKLSERRGLTVIELAGFGRGDGVRQALSDALGIALPKAGHSAETSGIAALSAGPGRWLLLAPEAAMAGLPNLTDEQAAVTDLTGGRAILALTGPRAVPTLMKGTAVDLDPAVFGPGSVAATALAHMPAIIWRRDSGYDVIVPRTYAVSLLDWMLEAGGLAKA
jgi:heterotetrameric sarcosine oxidase gamma subunit